MKFPNSIILLLAVWVNDVVERISAHNLGSKWNNKVLRRQHGGFLLKMTNWGESLQDLQKRITCTTLHDITFLPCKSFI
jgi:hypothetical protein